MENNIGSNPIDRIGTTDTLFDVQRTSTFPLPFSPI